jgi:thiol-disulfide isomerase/thioredoxin
MNTHFNAPQIATYARLAAFLLALSHAALAQTTIEVKVKQSLTPRAKLLLHQGKQTIAIDSCRQSEPGLFVFHLPQGYRQGLYKIVMGKNINFNIVVGNEASIKLETVVYAAEDSLKAIESRENDTYFKYLRVKRQASQQGWLLGSLAGYYPDGSLFGQMLRDEQYRVETELYNRAQELAGQDTSLFVSSLINLESKPVAPSYLTREQQNEYMIKNWWAGIDLTDERLLNTPYLESKLWDFAELLLNDRYDKEQQDSVFLTEITGLMSRKAARPIRELFRASLYHGFVESDYYPVTEYLEKTAFEGLNPIPANDDFNVKLMLERHLGVGKTAYDFKIKPLMGNPIKLSKQPSNLKLLLFWSTWCPHCIEMIPEIHKVYSEFRDKGFEVIAIAIDEDVPGWKAFVEEKRFCWTNMIEPDRDNSKIIINYNVDETPKMFLIDRNLKILSRPTNPHQLRVKLNRLMAH